MTILPADCSDRSKPQGARLWSSRHHFFLLCPGYISLVACSYNFEWSEAVKKTSYGIVEQKVQICMILKTFELNMSFSLFKEIVQNILAEDDQQQKAFPFHLQHWYVKAKLNQSFKVG